MQSYNEESQSLWSKSEEGAWYPDNLNDLYRRSSLLLDFAKLAEEKREDICKIVGRSLIAEGVIGDAAKDLPSLLSIVDILQRSIAYSLFVNDNSIALKTLRDIYSTASSDLVDEVNYSELMIGVLSLIEKELLILLDDLNGAQDSTSTRGDLRRVLKSIFRDLETFASGNYPSIKSLQSKQSLLRDIHSPGARLFADSYLRREPEQSAVIVALFIVAGFSLFSFEYGFVGGLVGAVLCLFLRGSAKEDQGLSK